MKKFFLILMVVMSVLSNGNFEAHSEIIYNTMQQIKKVRNDFGRKKIAEMERSIRNCRANLNVTSRRLSKSGLRKNVSLISVKPLQPSKLAFLNIKPIDLKTPLIERQNIVLEKGMEINNMPVSQEKADEDITKVESEIDKNKGD